MNDMNGAYLKDLRKQHNETQEALAEVFGYSQKAISAWENNRNTVPLEIVRKYAEHYNIPYGEFTDIYFHGNSIRDAEAAECAVADDSLSEPGENVKQIASGNISEPAKEGDCEIKQSDVKESAEVTHKKRKLHPVLKTFLISFAVMFSLLGIIIGIIVGIIIGIERESNLQGNIYYYADVPKLVFIALILLITPTFITTSLHFIIRLLNKLRRKKK